jgi:hypothetical protein
MTEPEPDELPDATNRQATALPAIGGFFVAAHHSSAIEWALSISRDPARRLAIARRIAREANTAPQTRLH